MNTDEDIPHNKYLPRPLIDFNGSVWTVGNAVEGVQIFGGIGSGKTSGSGRLLALKYLAAGFGGLVLTVKPDERKLWKRYCDLAGRTNDLMVIEENGENTFNFLEYESAHGETANIVQVMKTVIRASEEKAAGVGQDPFWENALDMLIFHVIDLCKLAYGRATVQQMYDIVQSLPTPDAVETRQTATSAFQRAFELALRNVEDKEAVWKNNLSHEKLEELTERGGMDSAFCEAVPAARLLRFVDQFFFETFLNLADKTRSIIHFSFSGFLFRLLRDPVHELFCRHASTVWPEKCLEGKIILINLPVKVYHKIGQDAQIMTKYIWQRAMERRQVEEDSLPVFLWADEAQTFLHPYDADYQATARSSLIATVYLSQNLPNYHANMGGAKSEYRVKSFLGTLATKIFHANADIETNRYASELIGDGLFKDKSKNTSLAGQLSTSRATHNKIDRIVRPEDFNGLQTGGEHNGRMTTAYIHFQGNTLNTGENFTKIQFSQRYQPQ